MSRSKCLKKSNGLVTHGNFRTSIMEIYFLIATEMFGNGLEMSNFCKFIQNNII